MTEPEDGSEATAEPEASSEATAKPEDDSEAAAEPEGAPEEEFEGPRRRARREREARREAQARGVAIELARREGKRRVQGKSSEGA